MDARVAILFCFFLMIAASFSTALNTVLVNNTDYCGNAWNGESSTCELTVAFQAPSTMTITAAQADKFQAKWKNKEGNFVNFSEAGLKNLRYFFNNAPLSFPISLTKNQWYNFTLKAEKEWVYDAVTREYSLQSIDAVPSILGVDLTAYAWWSSSYGFKRQRNVTTANMTAAVTLLPLFTTRDWTTEVGAGKMQADFDDLRAINGSEDTAELFELESVSSNVDYRWIAANLSANATTAEYDYYGNGAATNASNGTAVFWPGSGYVSVIHASENTGTTAKDSAGSDNAATLNDATNWTTSGKFGNAFNFSGVANSYAYVADNAEYTPSSTRNVSVSGWFYARAIGYDLAGKAATSNYEWMISAGRLTANKLTCITLTNVGGTIKQVDSTTSISLNEWHYFVCEFRTDGSVHLWLDGVNEANSTTGAVFPTDGTAAPAIGRSTSLYPTNARMDEIRFYNRSLEWSEIKANWHNGAGTWTSWGDEQVGCEINVPLIFDPQNTTLTSYSNLTAAVNITGGSCSGNATCNYVIWPEINETTFPLENYTSSSWSVANNTNYTARLLRLGSNSPHAVYVACSYGAFTNYSALRYWTYAIAGTGAPSSPCAAPTSGNATVGTTIVGSYASLANADNSSWNVTEVTGVPGYDLRVNFTNVTGFDSISNRIWYDGSASHVIYLEIWSYNSSTWEQYFPIISTSNYAYYNFSVPDSNDHISGGIVQVRLYHSSSGNAAHKVYWDYSAICNIGICNIMASIDPTLTGYNYSNNTGSCSVNFNFSAINTSNASQVPQYYYNVTHSGGNTSQQNNEDTSIPYCQYNFTTNATTIINFTDTINVSAVTTNVSNLTSSYCQQNFLIGVASKTNTSNTTLTQSETELTWTDEYCGFDFWAFVTNASHAIMHDPSNATQTNITSAYDYCITNFTTLAVNTSNPDVVPAIYFNDTWLVSATTQTIANDSSNCHYNNTITVQPYSHVVNQTPSNVSQNYYDLHEYCEANFTTNAITPYWLLGNGTGFLNGSDAYYSNTSDDGVCGFNFTVSAAGSICPVISLTCPTINLTMPGDTGELYDWLAAIWAAEKGK